MRNKITTLLAAFLVLALAGVALAQSEKSFSDAGFVAELSGANEVPSNDSTATGEARFILDGDTLRFELEVQGGVDMLAEAGAHIHCGAPDVNGPVVAFLAGPVLPNGFDGDFEVKASINADSVLVPEEEPCGDSFEDLIENIEAGNTYVNVHSAEFPGGEIRGQIESTG